MGDPRTQLPLFPDEPATPTRFENEPGFGGSFASSLLGLLQIEGLGRIGISALFRKLAGNLADVWSLDELEIQETLTAAKVKRAQKIAAEIVRSRDILLELGDKYLHALKKLDTHVLHQSELPPQLMDLRHPPLWLFVEGNPQVLWKYPGVAVVGTREPSPLGLNMTRRVVNQMSIYPLALVSGLAEGIDAAAHQAALAAKMPNIAFLGHGIDLEFPKATVDIRVRIVRSGGAVATEYLPGEHYKKQHFVERNRLQAALARVVIPIEAKTQSGTAHTVRFAQELRRLLIGVTWKGANGISEKLRADGQMVVDLEADEGLRYLDRMFRDISRETGQPTNALQKVIREFMRERRFRDVRRQDMLELIAIIEKELSSVEDN